MAEYIKKAEVLRLFNSAPVWTELDAISRIKVLPTIDLDDYVPKDFHNKTCEAMAKAHQKEITNMASVVRCKECKWYDNGQNESDSWNYCTRHFKHYIDVNADDFCSYGERSE